MPFTLLQSLLSLQFDPNKTLMKFCRSKCLFEPYADVIFLFQREHCEYVVKVSKSRRRCNTDN